MAETGTTGYLPGMEFLPAELDAEYFVIGSLLLRSEIANELISLTRPEDFTIQELRTIYNAAVKILLEGREVDPVSILKEVDPVAALYPHERTGYRAVMMGCMEIVTQSDNWRQYVKVMREQTQFKRFREVGLKFGSITSIEEARDLVSRAAELLNEQARVQVVTMAAAIAQFYTEQGEKRQFISWGFHELDKKLFTDYGDFVILAGRPSDGKTALALQMAAHMSLKERVGFYSLETTTSKLTDRFMANRCILDFSHIKRREMTEEEWTRAAKEKKELLKHQLEFVHASGWSVQDILSTALSRQQRIVFIDYLQLIRSPGKNRTEQVTNISIGLHTMAQMHHILVVALSQFNRESEQSRGRTRRSGPELADLRESGQLEQDADAVISIARNKEYDALAEERTIQVLKNKEGELGEFHLAFDGSSQLFAEYAPGDRSIKRQAERIQKRYAQLQDGGEKSQ